MIPVKQTLFGDHNGDCFRACVASIFELQLESIPNFCDQDECKAENKHWMDRFNDWLRPHGLYYMEVNVKTPVQWLNFPSGYHTIGGKSPRGNFNHSVVGQAGKPIHDPHPDNTFLDGDSTCEGDPLCYGFFVMLDPSGISWDLPRLGE